MSEKNIKTYEDLQRYYRFTTGDEIGKGGFGKVFKAWDTVRTRYIAIKACEVKGDSDPYTLMAETQMVTEQIPTHTNIAYYKECYRVNVAHGQFDYAIMDYYPLGNLKQLHTTTRLNHSQKQSIALQILLGIQHLHTKANKGKGIIHRDLKPANILIAKDESADENNQYIPKITDFGISKSLSSGSGHTSNSFVGGTLYYAAPEQLSEEAGIGKNADLWSWGVLVYELYTGELPYKLPPGVAAGTDATRRFQYIQLLLNADAPSLLHKIPHPMRHAVTKALTVNHKVRPKTAEELIALIAPELLYNDDSTNPKHKNNDPQPAQLPDKTDPNNFLRYLPYLLFGLPAALVVAGLLIYINRPISPPINPAPNTGTDTTTIAPPPPPADDSATRAEQLLLNANELYVDGNYKKAKEKAQEALKLQPNNDKAKKIITKCDEQMTPKPDETATKPAAKPTETTTKPTTQTPPPPPAANDPFANQMVYVQGGTFTMGCTPEQGSDCEDDEKPPYSKTVSNFYMGKYEVTQKQWRQVMGSNPPKLYNTGCDQCPVENVSHDDIQQFLKKLNQQTGKSYRLPTEAEWEYAARGGNKSKGYKYAGSNNIDAVAWYYDNYQQSKHGAEGTTHPVGAKLANELGLYDMSGNVWEWCQDWYKGYPGSSGVSDKTGADRVLRGGGWDGNAQDCRVSNRPDSTPGNRDDYCGFRLVVFP